jgi:phospholipid transport system transporter-binding protein
LTEAERTLTEEKAAEAAFEVQGGDRSRVLGALRFGTVSALLRYGATAIGDGHAAVIDLSAVSASDSSGLALLIEWLSVAKQARRALRYENVPEQLKELARLSDVESLLLGVAAPAGGSPAAPAGGSPAAPAGGSLV